MHFRVSGRFSGGLTAFEETGMLPAAGKKRKAKFVQENTVKSTEAASGAGSLS